mmetsp:Transcript_46862/g.146896  ORF Transcript_46862/g.146896 Transcript_46862/m.146896 type:complete len:305 (-) Transcript_46862:2313-3227(-)
MVLTAAAAPNLARTWPTTRWRRGCVRTDTPPASETACWHAASDALPARPPPSVSRETTGEAAMMWVEQREVPRGRESRPRGRTGEEPRKLSMGSHRILPEAPLPQVRRRTRIPLLVASQSSRKHDGINRDLVTQKSSTSVASTSSSTLSSSCTTARSPLTKWRRQASRPVPWSCSCSSCSCLPSEGTGASPPSRSKSEMDSGCTAQLSLLLLVLWKEADLVLPVTSSSRPRKDQKLPAPPEPKEERRGWVWSLTLTRYQCRHLDSSMTTSASLWQSTASGFLSRGMRRMIERKSSLSREKSRIS